VDKLIEKTQREAVQEGPKAGGSGLSFAFAKVWSADKHDLEEVVEEDQTDSWAQALEKLNEEKQKEHNRQLAESGRGVRRRAADIAQVLPKLVSFFLDALNF
jgi:chromodomain-helicase-DNA-binding protein 4